MSRARQSKLIQLHKDHLLSLKNSGMQKFSVPKNTEQSSVTRNQNKKTSITRQVWQIKTKSEPYESSNEIQKISTPKDPKPSVRRTGNRKTSVPCQVWRIKTKRELSDPQPSSVGRSGIEKTSVPHQVWERKKKSQHSRNRSKPSIKYATPTFHITWDGFDKQCEPIGENCALCCEDLSCAVTTDDDYDEYYDDLFKPSDLPEVAVLPCGHSFHSECLHIVAPDDKSTDPPCYLCSNNNNN